MLKYNLYHYSFCPFSRKIRFLLDEIEITYKKIEIKPYEKNNEFIRLNTLNETPVLIDNNNKIRVIDSYIIADYLKNMEYRNFTDLRDEYFGSNLNEELEINRLQMLFDKNFYNDITKPLLYEKVYSTFDETKKYYSNSVVNKVVSNINAYVEYMEFLLVKNKWLADEKFSLADISAAAQISVIDYFGHINWKRFFKLKEWYNIIKSKKGFNDILNDKLPGFNPYINYNKIDF